jgi:catechol 2,3-dioxygenase-like lactoylglutathione lyase family enzyme
MGAQGLAELTELDHYTLVARNARQSAEFHIKILGFTLLRIQELNTGTLPEGQVDMLNYVLELPGGEGKVCVITEGLTPETVFQRYLEQFGEGVHHVGYRVDDLEATFERLKREGVCFTSEQVLVDPLTALRQVFIAREHAGYFIELIERTAEARAGAFMAKNMAGLARTMEDYLGRPDPAQAEAIRPAASEIRTSKGCSTSEAFRSGTRLVCSRCTAERDAWGEEEIQGGAEMSS